MTSNNQRPVGRPREFDEKAVLEAAMDVFWSKGFESASLTELCRSTGLHKGSLYQAFGDKHQLFMRALQHYAECEFVEVLAVVSEQATPLENILAVVHKIIDIAGHDRGCLMINTMVELAPHDSRVREAVLAFGGKRLQALTGLITEARDAGQIRPDLEPDRLARHLMMTMAGAATMVKGVIGREQALEVLEDLVHCWTPDG